MMARSLFICNRFIPLSLLAIVVIATHAGCEKPKPETLVTSGYDVNKMDGAIARAKSEIDDFIADFKAKKSQNYSVKAPITDGEDVEHFWLTDIEFDGENFHGLIGNEPGVVSNVKFGQKWTLAKDEISDWMFMRDGKMYGNYTMRPLFDTMPPEQAAKFKSMLAEP